MGPVDFSPEALEAFRNQVRKASGVRAIRLGVRGGACNGLQYAIEFDYGDVKSGDIEWNPTGWDEMGYHHGQMYNITFRVDKKSVVYLSGSTVVWHKSLMREGFEFKNPNETSKCGCGHSFNVK